MSLNISDREYEEILKQIESEDSPVGIDAGKTHVLILHILMNIEQRLATLESRLSDEEE